MSQNLDIKKFVKITMFPLSLTTFVLLEKGHFQREFFPRSKVSTIIDRHVRIVGKFEQVYFLFRELRCPELLLD